jgi:hypothetical protein
MSQLNSNNTALTYLSKALAIRTHPINLKMILSNFEEGLKIFINFEWIWLD